MAIDFPNSPSDGDTFLGANGINYIYDSTDGKWEVYNDPAYGTQVWNRDPGDAILEPVYDGDGIKIQNSGGNTTITLASNGTVTAESLIGDIDLDSFPALP